MRPATIGAVRRAIVACERCPELREYCADIARRGKPEFAGQTYWGKPVPPLGDSGARVMLVGLAPAAHGGNRTGRMFTGDGSAAWLARSLYRAGFATQDRSERRGDGFAMIDAYLTAAIRCAPPKNKPTTRQLERCAGHMRAELALLPRLEIVVGLGKIGFDVGLARLAETGFALPKPRPRFGHGVEFRLFRERDNRAVTVFGTYHPSRQNTNTGKLTQAMLDDVFVRVRTLLDTQTP
ncbi:MAG TPA: uracil-DNA glycosylase [Candidatus Eremiobacteraceae bacterium]